MALLSMINASDRAALDALMSRVDRNDARLPALIDTLMRLSALEGEVTVALYNAYREHSAQQGRDRLTTEFRDGIVTLVDNAFEEGEGLREQRGRASVVARRLPGKARSEERRVGKEGGRPCR